MVVRNGGGTHGNQGGRETGFEEIGDGRSAIAQQGSGGDANYSYVRSPLNWLALISSVDLPRTMGWNRTVLPTSEFHQSMDSVDRELSLTIYRSWLTWYPPILPLHSYLFYRLHPSFDPHQIRLSSWTTPLSHTLSSLSLIKLPLEILVYRTQRRPRSTCRGTEGRFRQLRQRWPYPVDVS